MPRNVHESSLSQPYQGTSNRNARHPSRREARNVSPNLRETIELTVNQRSSRSPPPLPTEGWTTDTRTRKVFKMLSSSSLQRVITPSRSSRVLMRSVSGLGMEDPVYGVYKSQETPPHPSAQMFDDMSSEDVPVDMQDLVTVASDPTADLHTGMGFHIACLKTLCSSLTPSQLSQVTEGRQSIDPQEGAFEMVFGNSNNSEKHQVPPDSTKNLDDMLRGCGAPGSRLSSLDPPKRVVRKGSFLEDEQFSTVTETIVSNARDQTNDAPPKQTPELPPRNKPFLASLPSTTQPQDIQATRPIALIDSGEAPIAPIDSKGALLSANDRFKTPSEEPCPGLLGCIAKDIPRAETDQLPKSTRRVESGSCILGTDSNDNNDNPDLQKIHTENVDLEDIFVSPRLDNSRDPALDLQASIGLFEDDDVPVIFRVFKGSRNHAMESLTQSMPEFSRENLPTEEPDKKQRQETTPKKLALGMELSKTRRDLTSLRRKNPRRAPALLQMALAASCARDEERGHAQSHWRRLPDDASILLSDGKLKHCRAVPDRSTGVHKDIEFVPSSRDLSPQGLSWKRKGSSPSKSKAALEGDHTAPVYAKYSKTANSSQQRRPCYDLPCQLPPKHCTNATPTHNNISKRSIDMDPNARGSPSYVPAFADDGESTIAGHGTETCISTEEASCPTLSTRTSDIVVPPRNLPLATAGERGESTATTQRWEAFSTLQLEDCDQPPKHRRRGGSSNRWAASSRHSQLTNDTCRSSESTVSLPAQRKWDGSFASSNSTEQYTVPQRTTESTFFVPNNTNHTASDNSWSTWITEEQSILSLGSGSLADEASLSLGGKYARAERQCSPCEERE